MKAFDERYDENCDANIDCSSVECDACTKMRAEVWKAALEWLKKELYENLDVVDDSAGTIIDRELADE